MQEAAEFHDPAAMALRLPKVDGQTARLYAIIARSAASAVIFRRGPSHTTRMLLWDLKTDRIEEGQWIRAHIHERRCDLSPGGKYLVYFAARHREPMSAWTAISRPPWFTALAVWEKGDCQGGGGLFDDSAHLRLNHRPQSSHGGSDEWSLQKGFRLPKRFNIAPLEEHSGWGEDNPIEMMRLARDGWRFAQEENKQTEPRDNEVSPLTCDAPITRWKDTALTRRCRLSLRVQVHAIREAQSRVLVETADIVDTEGNVLRDLGRVDWADLDHNGDVLYARSGCLYRLPLRGAAGGARTSKSYLSILPAKLVADLNPMEFAVLTPPVQALTWR